MLDPSQCRRSTKQRYFSLAGCCLLVAVVWLVVFPKLAEQPVVRARIDYLDSQGIDPTAMFYTELEVMDRVLNQMDAFHREHPTALWVPDFRVSSAENPK